jgi:large subunit ribosomal protein L30
MMQKKVKTKDTFPMMRVTQTGSPIGRDKSQRATLIGLGLNKIRRFRDLPASPDIMGMVSKVSHLVSVEKLS